MITTFHCIYIFIIATILVSNFQSIVIRSSTVTMPFASYISYIFIATQGIFLLSLQVVDIVLDYNYILLLCHIILVFTVVYNSIIIMIV